MDNYRSRIMTVMAILGILFFVIAARLFVVQILQGQEYSLKSRKQSKGRVIVPAARGMIFDRN